MWSVYDRFTDDPESDMERFFRQDDEDEEQEDDRTLDDYYFTGE